jgi:hypothetical protein
MVTGEGLQIDGGAVQPGGRRPAPGRLATVQAYINSFFDLEAEWGADLFATPGTLASWLAARELLPAGTTLRARDRTRAIAVREGLRGLAAGNNDASPQAAAASLAAVNRAGAGARVVVVVEPTGPASRPPGAGWTGRWASC